MRFARGPNTRLIAAVSTASLAFVPVPCALMASISDTSSVEARNAACIAAAWPATFGRAICPTSVARPYPRSSPWIAAPRSIAWSQDSSTTTAAPSPSTMPLRFFANGLQEADAWFKSTLARVCSDSHASNEPSDSGASDPPAIATSSSPCVNRNQASPIATAPDEHAVEYVRFGPRSWFSIPIHAAPALCIPISTVSGLMRSDLSPYRLW